MNIINHCDIKKKICVNKDSIIYNKVLFFSLLMMLPLSKYIPAEAGWENGIIENAQVVVLCLSALFSLSFSSPQLRKMSRAICSIYILMIGRELSWGRVFLTPTEITALGPEFPPMKSFVLYPILYFFIGLTLLGIAYTIYKNFKISRFLMVSIPRESILVLLTGITLQIAAEHLHIGVFQGARGQIIEEFSELVVYLEMMHLLLYYGVCFAIKEKFKLRHPYINIGTINTYEANTKNKLFY